MRALPDRLAQAQPASSETTLFTATSRTTLAQAVVCNTSGSPQTFVLRLVPFGATPGGQHALIDTTLPGKSTLVWDFAQVLLTGDFLSAIAQSPSAVTVTVSGVVIT